MYKFISIAIFTVLISFQIKAQSEENNTDSITTEYVEKAFWTTKINNSQSIENILKGELNVNVEHRMGRLNDGYKKLFGIFTASSQLGFDYGITDRLMVGVGACSNQYTYIGYFKFKVLRQSTGKRNMPISLSWYSNIENISADLNVPENKYYYSQRLSYVHQMLIARKFNDNLTLQFTPSFIHVNMVRTNKDLNNIISVGFSGKYKISKKIALTAEYIQILPNHIKSTINGNEVVNSMSVGVDIFTGKHVFQLFLTNSTATNEKSFITETTEKWNKANIHLGFNVSRIYTIVESNE